MLRRLRRGLQASPAFELPCPFKLLRIAFVPLDLVRALQERLCLCRKPRALVVVLWKRRSLEDAMPDLTAKLTSKILLIFELEGWQGVESYAKANGIPLEVCRKIIADYLATDRGGFMR